MQNHLFHQKRWRKFSTVLLQRRLNYVRVTHTPRLRQHMPYMSVNFCTLNADRRFVFQSVIMNKLMSRMSRLCVILCPCCIRILTGLQCWYVYIVPRSVKVREFFFEWGDLFEENYLQHVSSHISTARVDIQICIPIQISGLVSALELGQQLAWYERDGSCRSPRRRQLSFVAFSPIEDRVGRCVLICGFWISLGVVATLKSKVYKPPAFPLSMEEIILINLSPQYRLKCNNRPEPITID